MNKIKTTHTNAHSISKWYYKICTHVQVMWRMQATTETTIDANKMALLPAEDEDSDGENIIFNRKNY